MKHQRGFTLLEVLVATAIMGIAVTGILSAISGASRNAARLTEYDRATLLARQRMDEILVDHKFPHKVWTECVKCIYFPERCVEYAMVKDLPGKGPTPPPIAFREKIAPSKHLPAGTIVPSEPVVPGMTIARPKAKA